MVEQADIDRNEVEAQSTDEHAELVRLRHDKRVFEMEVETLKRANYLAQKSVSSERMRS